MTPLLRRRTCALAAALPLALTRPGCAVVGIAGTAASAAISVGSAAVSVGRAVVGTTAKVAAEAVEKTVDLALPSGAPGK